MMLTKFPYCDVWGNNIKRFFLKSSYFRFLKERSLNAYNTQYSIQYYSIPLYVSKMSCDIPLICGWMMTPFLIFVADQFKTFPYPCFKSISFKQLSLSTYGPLPEIWFYFYYVSTIIL